MTVVRDLIFDIGMHKGEDTDYYLRKGYRVVAFEADPELAAGCRDRFADALADGRLTIVEGAIADSHQPTVRFYRHPVLSVWGSVEEDWASRNTAPGETQELEVATVDFGACLRAYGVPYYMKVDIEGADRLCIEALRPFGDRPAYLSLESEKRDFRALEAEVDLLEALGYDRFAAVEQSSIPGSEILTEDLHGAPVRHRFEADSSGPFGDDLTTPWMDRRTLLERYRRIFRLYRVFGDRSLFERWGPAFWLRGRISRILRRPLPGWYDTHASRSA
jgi:FkbM family methyltransferase